MQGYLNFWFKAVCLACFAITSVAQAADKIPISFNAFLYTLKQEAVVQGISKVAINSTLKNVKYLPSVVQHDYAQPEFITPFTNYLEKRISAPKLATGRTLMQEHIGLLNALTQQYGVPANVLVAFWGLETHYGQNKGGFWLPASLATLAYEGRRADFFKQQMFDVMRIIEAKHLPVASLRGSWAGAFGHMQFMPSTFVKYAVDGDGDQKINLITSLPDALTSAAHYLNAIGWQANQPIAQQVLLPPDFAYQNAQYELLKSTQEWELAGVKSMDGSSLPTNLEAAIILPEGWQGPAFMVYSNFRKVMDWNKSVNYALTIAYFADNLMREQPLDKSNFANSKALSYEQMAVMQTKLNVLGYDCGTADGFPGLRTQAAVRQYQAAQHLPQDGYAGSELYNRLIEIKN